MHLFASMAVTRKKFVDWEEHYVSHDRGSRLVHYYLKDRHGFLSLAVVGTERSVRHMVYVVSDEFLPLAGLDKSSAPCKWRSRREVLDWLSTFLAKPRNEQQASKSAKHDLSMTSDLDLTSNGDDTDFLDGSSQDEGRNQLQALKKHHVASRDIIWVGAAWSCRKRLQHYHSFQRNGITISVHNFVYVMSEGNDHHIAYIEDMYEDRKSKKKLRVRWFHKTEELVGPVPPPTPHPKEVFMTPFPQVLSVECVDGVATVLTPEHYIRCVTFSADAHICFRQFDNEGVKPFTISNVEGYRHQKVLALIESSLPRELSPNSEPTSDSMEIDEDEEAECIIKRRRRTARYSKRQICIASQITSGCTGTMPFTFQPSNRLVSSGTSDSGSKSVPGEMCSPASINTTSRDEALQAFDVGDKVELLSQDSGIRGCWYRCTVLRRIPRHLKVRYEELEIDDGHGKLEEWIPYVKLALPDRLGIRIPGRPVIRPLSSEPLVSDNCEIGSAVDAWWNDGWWEGVVLSKKFTEILVYFPDENDYATFQPSDLRVSRDWINGQWVDVKSSIEVMKTLSSMLSVLSIHCFALDRVEFCLQQSSAVSHNVPTLVTEVSVLPEHLERAAGCATPSGKHVFPVESKDVGDQKESNFESSKDDHPLAMTSEVKAYVDAKKESPRALSKQQNMQLIELGGRSDSVSIHQEHEHLNASKGNHEVQLKQISSKKRPYQLDVLNVLRNVKSGSLIPGPEIRYTYEEGMAEQERWTGKGEACLEALKGNDMYEQVIGAEEVAKMKKSRTVHETLKPLQGPTMGNPLFINSAPLAGLVMSR